MLKIYGHPMSTCTRKALMTCAENDIPFELVTVDFMKGEHKQPAHLGRQPFGQMPALEDEGFMLYESRPMSRYLNDKVSGKLVPSDLKERALMDQWISVETSNFTPHAMTYIYNYTFQRTQEPAKMEAAGKAIDLALSVMENRLAVSPFLAGSTLTLADIYYMPYIEYVMATPGKELFAKYPHVMAWWNKISERPTWRKVANRAS